MQMGDRKESLSNSQGHRSLLSLLVDKRHVLHAGKEGRIAAVVGGAGLSCEAAARLSVLRTRTGLLTIIGTTGGRVGIGSWVATVVGRRGTIARAGWIVSTIVHRATAGSHVRITSSESTVATVHLLWILLALCPRRHAIGGLRGVGWKLMRESVMTIVVVGLRSIVTTAA